MRPSRSSTTGGSTAGSWSASSPAPRVPTSWSPTSSGPRSRGVTPEERLAELGLSLPAVVPPVAAYVPAVRSGSLVFTSGQLPMVDGVLPRTGKVGAEVDPAEAHDLARQCALNALAAVKAEVGDLSAIVRVVKVVGFVASAPGFTGQPQVVNGASELLQQVFGDAGRHARSAVGVAVLTLDAPVEVELVVELVPDQPWIRPHEGRGLSPTRPPPEDRPALGRRPPARASRSPRP